MSKFITGLTTLLVAGAVAVMFWPEGPARKAADPARKPGGPSGVVVTLAETRTFTDTIEALATALANESVVLTADVEGRVERIHFEDGQEVAAGALLVTLDSDKERAQVNAAQVNLDTQRIQYRRLVDLVQKSSAAQTDLDAQVNAVKQAEAQLEAARANLADRRILAPFAGTLGIRRVSQGALVDTDTEIVTLDDLHVMKLDFSVPEIYFAAVRTGLEVEAQSAAYPDRPMKGRITTVGTRVDPVTRTFELRALVPNDERLLRPGMLMTAALLMPPRESIAVPEESLLSVEQRHFVFRVGDDDKAARVAVKLGARRPGVAEIVGGLAAGDRVVVEGTTRIRPGAAVKVIETRALAASTDPAASPGKRGG